MKNIKLDHITKIEGHAKLHVKIADGEVEKADLNIFEGSRFFEGILKGKRYDDLSSISSRICGVCSVVHGLTSLRAVEDALNVEVSEQTNKLRELLNTAGILQSHVLHLYFMVLPDYRNFTNAIKMAVKYKEDVKCALELKKFGNKIVRAIGGRDIHPFTSVIGGFSKNPEQKDLDLVLNDCEKMKKLGLKTVKLFSKLVKNDFEKENEYFALHKGNYFYGGKSVSCSSKKEFCIRNYEKHFKEYFQKGSTAEFVMDDRGKSYMVGALARILNKGNELSDETESFRKTIKNNKFSPNMNILSQAVEVYECVKKIEEILKNLKVRKESPVKIKKRSGTGFGALEAPRGILFHKYELDEKGYCKSANITTPTSQNLMNLQENVRAYLPKIISLEKDKIREKIEELIRAYDPCISCSTHFLELKLDEK